MNSSAVRTISIYLVCTMMVIAAGVLRLALSRFIADGSPLMIFVFPCMAAAVLYGLMPGLYTTALSMVIGTFVFLSPTLTPELPDLVDGTRLIMFAAQGVFISVIGGQLMRSRRQAEDNLKAKTRFVASVSHELRTPLTPAVVAVDELLRDPSLPERYRETVEMLSRNLQVEARLVDDLLDVSKGSAGKLHMNQQPLLVADVIEEAVNSCEAAARSRQVALSRQLRDSAAWVLGDSGRLVQVACNLIDNAVRHSPKDSAVMVQTDLDGQGNVVIAVRDLGSGIEPSIIRSLFKPFQQGRGGRVGGLGLGLSIVNAIVAGHGGKVWAENHPSGGAAFYVSLPVIPPVEAPKDVPWFEMPPTSVIEAPPANILLVEDHRDTAKVLSRILRSRGWSVDHAGTVAEGLARLDAVKYDLLLSDISLPDGTGHELAPTAKRRGVASIAMTGHGEDQDFAASQKSGFVGHIVKPVQVDRLIQAITDQLPH